MFEEKINYKSSSNNAWRGYLWNYAPLVLWIAVIFFASSNAGSMSNTSLIVRPLLLWLVPDISESSLLVVHGYVRKLAHFVVYFILGLFTARTFVFALEHRSRKIWFLASFAFAFSVAALDETNQSFLASRTGSIYDVLLDTASGTTALLSFHVFKQKTFKREQLKS